MFEIWSRVTRLETQVRIQEQTIKLLCVRLGIDPGEVDPFSLDVEEKALIAGGRKIEAIKHHRQRTGSSLIQAKEAADRG